MLTDITINNDSLEKVVFLLAVFAKAGDNVFDIAKNFKASADLILKENELYDFTLQNDTLLLIPMF